ARHKADAEREERERLFEEEPLAEPPGTAVADVSALIGQFLSERLGQQSVIENRPGVGGNIATETVVRSPPDGYTLLLLNSSNTINATLYNRLNFDFIRDIAAISGLATFCFVMEVNPSVPTKTLPEFIAYAKANPGSISWQRVYAPRCRRVVQNDGQCRNGPCAISRFVACTYRSLGRPSAGNVRCDAL